jgi:sugar phosphate permease
MLVRMMAVIVRVLVAVSGRLVGVLMTVMGMRRVFMSMLVLMFIFAVAAHLLSPPSCNKLYLLI